MGDAEALSEDERKAIVALAFTAPRLRGDEVRHKMEVCNDILAKVSAAIDLQDGTGSGQASIQLLLDGAPTMYAALFHGVEVARDGQFSIPQAVANLNRRPDAEHRALLDRGIMDLIERALSFTVEELHADAVDALLEKIAGYQRRLRG